MTIESTPLFNAKLARIRRNVRCECHDMKTAYIVIVGVKDEKARGATAAADRLLVALASRYYRATMAVETRPLPNRPAALRAWLHVHDLRVRVACPSAAINHTLPADTSSIVETSALYSETFSWRCRM